MKSRMIIISHVVNDAVTHGSAPAGGAKFRRSHVIRHGFFRLKWDKTLPFTGCYSLSKTG